jgi:actin related protein 2/3 complex subunit 1A/1B
VWTFDAGVWKPNLVILRINRAATHVKWSPDENKFAVASGAKCVSVCYYEEPNQWWVSKHIKKHKSTVLKVDWHPNNVFLATGSSDFKARVFSAFIKGVDNKPPSGPFGTKLPFGELLLELDSASGWVHAIKWSPSGNVIAFSGHDSSVNFAYIQGEPPAAVQRIRLPYLPVRELLFLSENSLVGVGEDANPLLFTSTDSGNWSFAAELDTKDHGSSKSDNSALNSFKSKVNLGSEVVADTKVETLHQNTITSIAIFGGSGKVSDFSTSGLDGSLAIWHVKTLESKLKGLKIA